MIVRWNGVRGHLGLRKGLPKDPNGHIWIYLVGKRAFLRILNFGPSPLVSWHNGLSSRCMLMVMVDSSNNS